MRRYHATVETRVGAMDIATQSYTGLVEIILYRVMIFVITDDVTMSNVADARVASDFKYVLRVTRVTVVISAKLRVKSPVLEMIHTFAFVRGPRPRIFANEPDNSALLSNLLQLDDLRLLHVGL